MICHFKEKTMERFTVRYQDGSVWVDVFPDLCGGYDWALHVSTSTWTRDGRLVTPEMMRIYKLDK